MKKEIIAKLLITLISALFLSSCNVSTSKSTPEIIPGWESYDKENVSFQLPDTYQDDTNWYKENYPDESINTFFFATEKDDMNNTIETVFSLSKYHVSEDLNFPEYVDGYIDLVNAVYQVIEHKEMKAQYPTEKIISIDENEYSQNINITYMVFVGEFVYRIEFQSEISTFDAYESQFGIIYNHIQFPNAKYATLFGENHQGIVQLVGILIMIFALIFPTLLKRRKKQNTTSSPEDFDSFKEYK